MLIKVKQGTDEWIEARKQLLINASTAPSAAGLIGAYDSRAKAYRKKMGLEEQKVTPPMLYGMGHEHYAKHDGEIAVGSLSFSVGIHVHDDYPWMGASTDGVFIGKGLHEIKCYFQSWTPSEQRIWIIYRNQDYFEWILPRLEEFCKYVLDEKPPPNRKRISYDGELKTELFYEGETHGISA